MKDRGRLHGWRCARSDVAHVVHMPHHGGWVWDRWWESSKSVTVLCFQLVLWEKGPGLLLLLLLPDNLCCPVHRCCAGNDFTGCCFCFDPYRLDSSNFTAGSMEGELLAGHFNKPPGEDTPGGPVLGGWALQSQRLQCLCVSYSSVVLNHSRSPQYCPNQLC